MALAAIMAGRGHHGGARPSWRGAAIMAGNAAIMAGRGHHGGARSSWRGAVIMAGAGYHR